MTERATPNFRRQALEAGLTELREVISGERLIGYINGPDYEIIEFTQSNAYAVHDLMAHAYAGSYPDLFPEFDAGQTPVPAQSAVLDSIGGPFGSINDWRDK